MHCMIFSDDSVKWVGRERRCGVDETEKGWCVLHIDVILKPLQCMRSWP
jgi:hypothetical protein